MVELETANMEIISDAVRDAFKVVETLYDKKMCNGLKVLSGFEKLDAIISGFFVGDLYVVCGESGVGKSSFAYSIARNLAVKARPPLSLALFCLNKTPEQVALKIICSDGETSYMETTKGHIARDDWPKLTSSAGRLADSPIHINYSNVASVQDLIRQVSNLVDRKLNISFLIIDSLQNLVPEDKEKTSECLRTLKAAALNLRLPVIITSSINMKKKRRDNRSIVADALYNVITKYADVVLILQKDEYDSSLPSDSVRHACGDEDSLITKIKTKVTIAKNSNGLTGSAFLEYLPQYGGFHDVDERPRIKWSEAY